LEISRAGAISLSNFQKFGDKRIDRATLRDRIKMLQIMGGRIIDCFTTLLQSKLTILRHHSQ
jgi:hypothetical protein